MKLWKQLSIRVVLQKGNTENTKTSAARDRKREITENNCRLGVREPILSQPPLIFLAFCHSINLLNALPLNDPVVLLH